MLNIASKSFYYIKMIKHFWSFDELNSFVFYICLYVYLYTAFHTVLIHSFNSIGTIASFETSLFSFRSGALTERAIRPSNWLVVTTNYLQLLQLRLFFSFIFQFEYYLLWSTQWTERPEKLFLKWKLWLFSSSIRRYCQQGCSLKNRSLTR